ncbi:RagB/SusD family nutrient uptake outer membrane protein [uncultured Algibacter sp.]|uniref:RagB/SusD family nutrient uptake outer membrane protein n=1 Tax=uncultured Algibacter sp. TaxID=298659 RepID=UPI00321744B1
MKKQLYLILALVLFSVIACDDYVDITPRGNAIVTTLDEVNFLLNDAETIASNSRTSDIPSLISDNIELVDSKIALASSDPTLRSIASIYNLEPVFYDANLQDQGWQKHYEIIGLANYILETVETISTDDEALKNQYAAEAKVHRAYHYFTLVNTYAPHFGLPEANVDGSGVPLLTVFSDDSVPINKSSVNDIYDFVLQDLEEAIPFLTETVESNDRASRASALGLLAQVHFHMGNYTEAITNANDALAISAMLFDYNTDLVPAFFGGSFPPNLTDNTEVTLLKTGNVPSFRFTEAFADYSDELVALSDVDNDLRFSFNQFDESIGKYVLFTDFEYQLGVTTPKVLLIKAESLARTGSAGEAMDIVNLLRSKRFKASFVTAGNHLLTAANDAEAIQHVIDEARREFHVAGQRFYDIKRLNAIENAGISLTRGGVTFAPNSINWAVPIGQREIDRSNGQITQNPRE